MSDLQYGFRQLVTRPGFTIAAVLTLGLGIGATTTMFSAVRGVLLRPLPFPEPERLVMLWESNPEWGWTQNRAAPANALDWREQVTGLENVAIFADWYAGFTLAEGGSEAVFVSGTLVSGAFFSVLGVAPALGRGFTDDETWAGSDLVAVLGHDLWRRRYGADPGIVGRAIQVDGQSRTVVGVMPPGFAYPNTDSELWVPWGWDPALREAERFRRAHFVRAIGRLAPDVAAERVRAELQSVAAQLVSRHT